MSTATKHVWNKAAGLATLDDLLAIPETQRFHELIEGVLVEKEAASGKHGEAQLSLGILLRPFRRGGAGGPGGWLFASEVEVWFSERTTLRPDVAGWRRERLPELPAEVPVRTIPDWVCEILSTNRANDLVRKKRIYHQHRIPHYWVIDPEAEMLTVYRHTPEGYLEVLVAVRGETVHAEPFAARELSVGVLFGDDEPA
ncbi:Uma2 family endonuclease [Paraliomyxa miuraensis]|uniref:Uma2 family endonuclease n=1 Tax=Paraliomyxa miuraensis TaxID=376150 RepID=UPI00224EB1F8|nr:Uma2 family endonuclease [Paraliomyxa miuraensis]MCX4248058.1 Uma2 family endonuclease [Paraliomyxa miuraensis]